MKTLEQRLQEVEDREEIKELFSDDGRSVDVVIGEKPNIEVRGRKELDKFYPALKKGMALPCIHNHIIELDGDNAKGTCTIEGRITRMARASSARAFTPTSIAARTGAGSLSSGTRN